MSDRLIPNGDPDFDRKAGAFARAAASEPGRFNLGDEDAQAMLAAATRFRQALHKARWGGGRSQVATREKDEARAEAERIFKRCIRLMRASESIDHEAQMLAGLRAPAQTRRARLCPQEPPYLRFARALHVGNGALPMHELNFRAASGSSRGRPAGAVRLELFVDLIAPDEPIPGHPGANLGGRPWYLRSYSRSPIRLAPPICRVPMLVVYWGRWADAIGNVGPFSSTIVARIEGHMPQLGWGPEPMGHRATPILDDPAALATSPRPPKYTIAVLDAQYRTLHRQEVSAALPAPQSEMRCLEAPAENEAA